LEALANRVNDDATDHDIATASRKHSLGYRDYKLVLVLLPPTLADPCHTLNIDSVLRIVRRSRNKPIAPKAAQRGNSTSLKPTREFVFKIEPKLLVREYVMPIAHNAA
jgi:hypothetical protein